MTTTTLPRTPRRRPTRRRKAPSRRRPSRRTRQQAPRQRRAPSRPTPRRKAPSRRPASTRRASRPTSASTTATIKIGLNADLSGIFAPLVTQIVDGQEAYWEIVNDNGGIAGRQVELVVLDNGYDVPTHLENYEVMSGDGPEGVVMFSQSTGSPHTTATADLLVEDDLIAIPLSWYSGWPDPAIGQNVFEAYTSYCVESMNGVTYMAEANERRHGRHHLLPRRVRPGRRRRRQDRRRGARAGGRVRRRGRRRRPVPTRRR